MCFFHFAKSIYRWIINNGLRTEYVANGRFRNDIRLLVSIAFVPPSFIVSTFDELRPTLSENARLVADYVEATYIRGNTNGALVFHPQFWSVYRRTLESQSRTNNAVEGLNNRLRNLVGRYKPGFWILIEKLQEEDRTTTAKINKSYASNSTDTADADSSTQDSLKKIVERYDQMTTFEYLKHISNFVMTSNTFLPEDID